MASAKLDPATLGDVLTVAITDAVQGLSTVEVALVDGRGEAVHADGWKVRAVAKDNGKVRVVVGNEDRQWDGTSLAEVGLLGPDGIEVTLPVQRLDQRRGARLDAILDAYGAVDVTVTAFDVDGNVVEEVAGAVVVEPADEGLPLEAVILDVDPDGQASLTTWTDGEDLSVSFVLRDDATGETVWTGTDETPLMTERQWVGGAVAFEDTPSGFPYTLSVGLADAEGNPLTEPDRIDVTMPAPPEGDVVGWWFEPIAEGAGLAGFYTDGTSFFPTAWYAGDLPVDAVTVTFEEPLEGPPPADLQVPLGFAASWDRYVQVVDRELPATWAIDVEVRSPDGRVLQSGTFTGQGAETVYLLGGRLIEKQLVSYSGRASGSRYSLK